MTTPSFADLSKRFIILLSLATLITLLVLFSHQLFVSIILLLFTAACLSVAVWEYANFHLQQERVLARRWVAGVSILFLVTHFFEVYFRHVEGLSIVVLFLGLVSLFIRHFKETSQALSILAAEFFAFFYIAIPLTCMIGILYPPTSTIDGRLWFAYLIVVTKITDMGGYFIGRLFGKHPLAVQISPKKTVEGAVAGLLTAIFASVIFSYAGTRGWLTGFYLPLSYGIFLGIVLGVMAQLGDLAESLLKRDAQVKDSNTVPAVGGMLDIIDSLLFTAPIVYYYIHFFL